MSNTAIYQKIEKTYNTEKGKNFISHLIRSFFPADRVTYVLAPDEKPNLVMKCCISGEKLYSKSDLFLLIADQTSKDVFFEKLMITVNKITGENEDEKPSEDLIKFDEKTKKIKENLAIISNKSDKVMSLVVWKELFNFIATEILKNNGHIKWLINSEKAKTFEKKSSNVKKKPLVVNTSAKNSLSDNDVLKSLKEKMK